MEVCQINPFYTTPLNKIIKRKQEFFPITAIFKIRLACSLNSLIAAQC